MHKTTVKKKSLSWNEHAVSTSAIKCTQSDAAQKKKSDKSKQQNDAPGILKAIKGMEEKWRTNITKKLEKV